MLMVTSINNMHLITFTLKSGFCSIDGKTFAQYCHNCFAIQYENQLSGEQL